MVLNICVGSWIPFCFLTEGIFLFHQGCDQLGLIILWDFSFHWELTGSLFAEFAHACQLDVPGVLTLEKLPILTGD